MSVTSFIHVNKAENHDFDLEKFSREIEKKYLGTGIEQSKTASYLLGKLLGVLSVYLTNG